jgi:ABC-type Mn2+/Zn2+ transport system permease subunit
LSAVLALASTWIGLIVSDLIPTLPPSSAVIAVATGVYALALIFTLDRVRPRRWFGRTAEN